MSPIVRFLTVSVATAALVLCSPALSYAAQEARCQELGSHCICSNKLDSAGWVPGAGTNWAMDATTVLDQTDKPCMTSGAAPNQHRLVMTTQTPPTVTSGLRGFPALQDNSTGTYVSAVQLTPSQHSATAAGVTAARYYFTLTGTTWTSTNEGGCTNDKYIQIGVPYMTTGGGGVWADNLGGGLAGLGVHECQNGTWCRIEMQRNRTTGTATFWVKNVTDNTAERSWTSNAGSDLGEFTDALHKYREGGCVGSASYMFAMVAHWPNPVGDERIGGAPELETGAPNRPAPDGGLADGGFGGGADMPADGGSNGASATPSESADDDGCACRTSRRSSTWWLVALGALVLLLGRRRR